MLSFNAIDLINHLLNFDSRLVMAYQQWKTMDKSSRTDVIMLPVDSPQFANSTTGQSQDYQVFLENVEGENQSAKRAGPSHIQPLPPDPSYNQYRTAEDLQTMYESRSYTYGHQKSVMPERVCEAPLTFLVPYQTGAVPMLDQTGHYMNPQNQTGLHIVSQNQPGLQIIQQSGLQLVTLEQPNQPYYGMNQSKEETNTSAKQKPNKKSSTTKAVSHQVQSKTKQALQTKLKQTLTYKSGKNKTKEPVSKTQKGVIKTTKVPAQPKGSLSKLALQKLKPTSLKGAATKSKKSAVGKTKNVKSGGKKVVKGKVYSRKMLLKQAKDSIIQEGSERGAKVQAQHKLSMYSSQLDDV